VFATAEALEPDVLEVLDEAECLRLLPTVSIGRIGYTEGALPAIQPVSFAVIGGQVLIPTRTGSKVAAASRGAVVAFEVDSFDAGGRTGWNVTVVGPSRLVRDPAEVAALHELGLTPWVPWPERAYIAVQISLLHGRRIRAAATPPAPSSPGTIGALDAPGGRS
jgi:hypothetical protein